MEAALIKMDCVLFAKECVFVQGAQGIK